MLQKDRGPFDLPEIGLLDPQRDQPFCKREPLQVPPGGSTERWHLLTIYRGYRDDAGGKAWNWRALRALRGN